MAIGERLSTLGLVLPDPPPRGGEYVPAVRVGELLFVSGHGPYRDGAYMRGKVGVDVSLETARAAARLTMLNVLATVHATLGDLERVERAVKVLGMVNSDPSFEMHSQVIDAGSELLIEVFGDRGRHARSAVGLAALPAGISVEIEVIFAVS